MMTYGTAKTKTCVDCGERVDPRLPHAGIPIRCRNCRGVHAIESAATPHPQLTDQLARAREILALVKAEFEKLTGPRWETGWDDAERTYTEVRNTAGELIADTYSERCARLISASHNAMPTALEDIEADLEHIEFMFCHGPDGTASLLLSRKLALLETLAREFRVEVET